MNGIEWFHQMMKTIPKSQQSPQLLRSLQKFTVMQTFQGDDGTCYAHLSARLFIQNILRLPDEVEKKENWTKRSVCRRMLNTYRPLKPTDDLTKCGTNGYLKISMFLFLYYHITERFGKDGGTILQSSSIYPSVLRKDRPKHFTKLYDPMYTAVSNYLSNRPPPPFFVNHVFLDEGTLQDDHHTGVVNLLLLFLKHRRYIGCRFYADNDQSQGHLFMITGYSQSKKAFYVKNTWGTYSSMLYVKDIGRKTITFDEEKIVARVNMFAFAYTTRDRFPIQFHRVDEAVVARFRKEFGDTSTYMRTNPFTRKTKS